jgi:hypothetical protein
MLAVAKLQSVLAWGVDDPRILSIDVEGDYSPTRAGATIVGMNAPHGIKVGANPVTVDLLVYGMDDTQTVNATLTVPANTAITGTLLAAYPRYSEDFGDFSSISIGSGIDLSVDSSGGRESIQQLAYDLNHALPDTTIKMVFQPTYEPSDEQSALSDVVPSTDPVALNIDAPWPISGVDRIGITTIQAVADPKIVSYGDFADIYGEVDGPSDPGVVSLFAKQAGSSTETLVATQTATYAGGALQFDFPLDEVFTNTTYRVHFDGTDSWSGADATVSLPVRAMTSLSVSASKVKLGKSVTLKAMVFPATTGGGTAVFEQLVGKTWKKIASKTLLSNGSFSSASTSYKPSKGAHKVRVRYLGGTYNYAATSGTKTVTAK